MKKLSKMFLFMIAIILMAASGLVVAEEEQRAFDLPDGKYVGVAPGYRGDIEIEVEIVNGKIAALKVLKQSETPIISDAAFDRLIPKVLEAQTLDLDTVSGATLTSRGILAAIQDALQLETEEDEGAEV